MTPRSVMMAAALATSPALALGDDAADGPAAAPAAAAAPTPTPARAGGPNDVWVAPGEEVALRVALGHINRIETPFPDFDIWTESPEQFEQRGHVFYVSPQSDRPISMFLTPKGDERLAFSLMLLPEAVKPAQVRLRLGALEADGPIPIAWAPDAPARGGLSLGATPAVSAPSFESGPYEDGLTALVKDFVIGMVPQGYAAAAQTEAHPRCRNVAGVSTSFAKGQRFIGPAFEVFVGVASNGAAIVRDFDETWCAGPDVAAVALWPASELAPGGRAEVLVVRRRAAIGETPVRMRASLVGE